MVSKCIDIQPSLYFTICVSSGSPASPLKSDRFLVSYDASLAMRLDFLDELHARAEHLRDNLR